MVRLPLIIRPMVWSSRALATASAAILPAAPTLLSTITGWPRALDRGSENRRAVRSGDEPAGKPTMIFRGLFGHAGGAAPWAQPAALSNGAGWSGRRAGNELGGLVRPRGGGGARGRRGCARQCGEPQPGMTANEA